MQHFLHILWPQFLLVHLLYPSDAQLTFLCFFAMTKPFPALLHWYSWNGLLGQFFVCSNLSLPLTAIVPWVKSTFPRVNWMSNSSNWKALYAIRREFNSCPSIYITVWIVLAAIYCVPARRLLYFQSFCVCAAPAKLTYVYSRRCVCFQCLLTYIGPLIRCHQYPIYSKDILSMPPMELSTVFITNNNCNIKLVPDLNHSIITG